MWWTWIRGAVRAAAVVAGGLALAIAVVVWEGERLLGFPDGHVTAYDAATVLPHRVFCACSVVAGGVLIALGVRGGRRAVRAIAVVAVLYAAAAVVVFDVVDDWYLRRHLQLDDGRGG